MSHAIPRGALAMTSVWTDCPHGWTLYDSYARLGGVIRRIADRRRPARWCGPGDYAEDLLTAGAWRNPFLDAASPGAPKSPRISIYNG
ncbi:hypothetical protein ACX80S_06610 [Arthrobacter sp. RHLT1-20]